MTRQLWIDYLCTERLKMSRPVLDDLLCTIKKAVPVWFDLIGRSYLSEARKMHYVRLVKERLERLGLL